MENIYCRFCAREGDRSGKLILRESEIGEFYQCEDCHCIYLKGREGAPITLNPYPKHGIYFEFGIFSEITRNYFYNLNKPKHRKRRHIRMSTHRRKTQKTRPRIIDEGRKKHYRY